MKNFPSLELPRFLKYPPSICMSVCLSYVRVDRQALGERQNRKSEVYAVMQNIRNFCLLLLNYCIHELDEPCGKSFQTNFNLSKI